LFTVSCDTGFAQIGLDLGATNLYDEAKAFGFDQTPPIDLPFPAKSNFPVPSSFIGNLPTLAYSAIGQENVEASPLQMALAGAAIADGGQIMKPHILDSITNSQNQVVSTYKPSKWLQATSSATAQQVTKLMVSVVSSANGTGTAARIPGVQVAAKTGTAQTGTHHTDDWFVAFAPANNPQIVVSVVLPNQGNLVSDQGGTLAAPIAKSIIESYLSPSSAVSSPSTTSRSASSGTSTAPTTSPTVG
jgi:peptidoglycan glycosyltransferase